MNRYRFQNHSETNFIKIFSKKLLKIKTKLRVTMPDLGSSECRQARPRVALVNPSASRSFRRGSPRLSSLTARPSLQKRRSPLPTRFPHDKVLQHFFLPNFVILFLFSLKTERSSASLKARRSSEGRASTPVGGAPPPSPGRLPDGGSSSSRRRRASTGRGRSRRAGSPSGRELRPRRSAGGANHPRLGVSGAEQGGTSVLHYQCLLANRRHARDSPSGAREGDRDGRRGRRLRGENHPDDTQWKLDEHRDEPASQPRPRALR